MRLLIISDMAHYYREGQIVGWGPTVEEINHLSVLFDQIEHIGCLHEAPAPDSSLPYMSDKIKFIPVPPSGGNNVKQKLSIIKYIPIYLKTIWRELDRSDAVHLRCPANISLFALFLLFLRKKPVLRWVKYAGDWGNYPKKPLSYKFQRWFLNQNLHKGVVTINGQWENQPDHVYTFINPSFSQQDYMEASSLARDKILTLPLQLLFVGRITKAKGVDKVLEIAKRLNEKEFQFTLLLVGDGNDRLVFEDYVELNFMDNQIQFVGWKTIQDLKKYYQDAHFFIFPSSSEGWPKVLSEAMAYGVVPLASSVSSIPQILNETKAGHAYPASQTDSFVNRIEQYVCDKDAWKVTSQHGVKSAGEFTYDKYLEAVRKIFEDNWGVNLNHG